MVTKIIISLTFVMLFGSEMIYSQPTINGPNCVLRNTEYHYKIGWNADSSKVFKICVIGGKIRGAEGTCINSKVNDLFVTISDSIAATLEVEENGITSQLKLSVAPPFIGGYVDGISQISVTRSSIPANEIKCSVAKGGSCNSLYAYQWQESFNNLSWKDIQGATKADFMFIGDVVEPFFIRRRATLIGSNTYAFSNTVTVFIQD